MMNQEAFIKMIKILLFLSFFSNMSALIDKKLPTFVQLPPPLQYYFVSPSTPNIDLKCVAWPLGSSIQFVVSTKQPWMASPNKAGPFPSSSLSSSFSSSSGVTLTPLNPSIGKIISTGHLRLSSNTHLTQIQDQNIHCMTATSFGTLLSRPFRISRAGIANMKPSSIKQIPQKKHFLEGNVGLVDCWLPESHPPANVDFYFRNKKVDMEQQTSSSSNSNRKYKLVMWPDGKRASLLIYPLSITNDNGVYSCSATNPITKQTRNSSALLEMVIDHPANSVAPSFIMPIAGRHSGPQQISARVNTNITMFCIMSGAPPPPIKIYLHAQGLSQTPDRYQMDEGFGTLTIRQLRSSDSGSYVCSDSYMSSTVSLNVIEPLNISTIPKSITLDTLSGSATFNCTPSKASASVYWLFNGRPITSNPDHTITISSVSASNLGIYQCIAYDHNEWVSQTATLSIKSYRLLKQPDNSNYHIQPPIAQNVDNIGKYITAPNVNRIYDNLAVLVRWKLMNHENLGPVVKYILQLSSSSSIASKSNIQNINWSPIVTVQQNITTTFIYVTHKYLRPQHIYRFRIHCVFQRGHSMVSMWSDPSSSDFTNMGPQAPKLISVRPTSDNPCYSLNVHWSFPSPTTSSTFHWPVKKFRIIYRQFYPNATYPKKKYSHYSNKDVVYPNMKSNLTNLVKYGVYQVRVYGIYESGSIRTTTIWSEPILVKLSSTPLIGITAGPPTNQVNLFAGLWESLKSNKIMYGCLLALIATLVLIMIMLIFLCICRRNKTRKNKANLTSNNPFPYGYKEVGSVNGGSKSMSVNNINLSNGGGCSQQPTLQLPGRMAMTSGGGIAGSNLALSQQQHQQQYNHNSLGRQTPDSYSLYQQQQQQMLLQQQQQQQHQLQHRAGSVQAMDTTSLVTDLYGNGSLHQHPHYHAQAYPGGGFSTLQPQGYPGNRAMPSYQQHPQSHYYMQQHHPHMGSIRRENSAMNDQSFDRRSIVDQPGSLEMSRTLSASQQQLLIMQQQQQQQQQDGRGGVGYYGGGQRAMSPQIMMQMMMNQQGVGSQLSLGAAQGQYNRRSISNQETPIAVSPPPTVGGHNQSVSDHISSLDHPASMRAMSPAHHLQQQQQQQYFYSQPHHQQDALYQSHRPNSGDYHIKYGSNSSNNNTNNNNNNNTRANIESEYVSHRYFLNPEMSSSSRQHTLNSLPEQPIDLANNNSAPMEEDDDENRGTGGLYRDTEDDDDTGIGGGGSSGGGGIGMGHGTGSGGMSNKRSKHSNNRSPAQQHHHRRKTRSRQSNNNNNISTNSNHDPSSLERSQMEMISSNGGSGGGGSNSGMLPPMLAPRQQMNVPGLEHDNIDPPMQYSSSSNPKPGPNNQNDNTIGGSGSAAAAAAMLIDNLPRIRDVSEYGIPHSGSSGCTNQSAPIPPTKSQQQQQQQHNNNNNNNILDPTYSSTTTTTTSSDISSINNRPSPPPKYHPHSNSNPLPPRPDEMVYHPRKPLYYQNHHNSDTHC